MPEGRPTTLGQDVTAAAALFLLLVGVLVILARPRARLNLVLGVLLALRGASDFMYHLMRTADTTLDAEVYLRVANWYVAPVPLLTLLILAELHPAGASRARHRAAFVAGIAAGVLVLPAMPWYDGLVIGGLKASVDGQIYGQAGPVAMVFGALIWLAEAAALWAAARSAASPTLEPARRLQASLLGLAFALPLAHMGGARVDAYARAYFLDLGPTASSYLTPHPWILPAFLFNTAVVVVGAALALASLRRLASPLALRVRARVPALVALAILLGLTEKHVGPSLMGHYSFRFLVLATAAACFALAIVRYDLAGLGQEARRRLAFTSHVGALAAAGLAPAAFALALTGTPVTSLGVLVLLGVGLLALSPSPAQFLSALARVAAPPPRLDAAPPSLPRRYEVEREIGRGASGRVLLARDRERGGLVVLKHRHAGADPRRALAEARALAAVRHPRIVPLLGVERSGADVVIVMAYAEGGSLRDLLAREGPQPPARAVALVADVLEGLGALHRGGLVHGDVKPGNVLLGADGRAFLGDLGSARAPMRRELELTVTGPEVLGSYGTAAPEVVAGSAPGAAADLYAAGALLHRLLTGEHYLPLEGLTAFQAAQAILHDRPALAHPRLPPALAPVLARALAKRPEERHPDAAAMAAALAEAARAMPG